MNVEMKFYECRSNKKNDCALLCHSLLIMRKYVVLFTGVDKHFKINFKMREKYRNFNFMKF